MKDIDTEELWRHVGLGTLREGLVEINKLVEGFEDALRDLPSCDKCARVTLVDQINKTGSDLGSKVIGLTALAGTLRAALIMAEDARNSFVQSCPSPCRCAPDRCECH